MTNKRKRPNAKRLAPYIEIQLTASLHSDEYLVELRDDGSGRPHEIYLTRAQARQARDWLNHFIEFTAQGAGS